jgi:hypothetical protein
MLSSSHDEPAGQGSQHPKPKDGKHPLKQFIFVSIQWTSPNEIFVRVLDQKFLIWYVDLLHQMI